MKSTTRYIRSGGSIVTPLYVKTPRDSFEYHSGKVYMTHVKPHTLIVRMVMDIDTPVPLDELCGSVLHMTGSTMGIILYKDAVTGLYTLLPTYDIRRHVGVGCCVSDDDIARLCYEETTEVEVIDFLKM